MSELKYFSESILAELKADVPTNIERYRETGFDDQASSNGWSIGLSAVEVDTDELANLDPTGGSAAEARNSLIVFNALKGMTPALATEERVWTRLTHFECLQYARERWPIKAEPKEKSGFLGDLTGANKKAAEERKSVHHQNVRQIETHYFARGRTGYRDDNAVSRLWWNSFIALRVDPSDQAGVLNELLRTADIRSNLVERPMLSNRAHLLRGIIDTMRNSPEVYGTETTFREFMKAINLRGSGVLFESLSEKETAQILAKCRDDALRKLASSEQAA
jgi:Family of unknown function (DUF6339)